MQTQAEEIESLKEVGAELSGWKAQLDVASGQVGWAWKAGVWCRGVLWACSAPSRLLPRYCLACPAAQGL